MRSLTDGLLFSVVAMVMAVYLPTATRGQPEIYYADFEWDPPEPLNTDMRFGSCLDVEGEVAIASIPFHGRYPNHHGSVAVYRYGEGEWQLETVLEPNDSQDRFMGWSASLSGSVVVAGAPDDRVGQTTGAANVFRYDEDRREWFEEARLTASDGRAGDLFGWSASVSGNTIMIGSRITVEEVGAVYVFQYDESSETWIETQVLTASDPSAGSGFAHTLAVKDDVAAIGAIYESSLIEDAGAAYIFRYESDTGQWREEAKVFASDPDAHGYFSSALDIDGDRLVVGAANHRHGSLSPGGAYIFRRNPDTGEWEEEVELLTHQENGSGGFGSAVGIDGELVLVSARKDGEDGVGGGGAGFIFQFDGTQWTERAKLLGLGNRYYDEMGTAAAIGDGTVLLSDPNKQISGVNKAGYVWVFDLLGHGYTSLELGPPIPGVVRQMNEWVTTGASIGETVYFIYGFRYGTFPVPRCSGVLVDIDDPLLFGQAIVGDTGIERGVARLTQYVPGVASGHRLLFQTVELSTCRVSNLVEYTFP